MIAPVGEKLLFEHNKISATRGGGDLPCHPPPPPDPPLTYSLYLCTVAEDYKPPVSRRWRISLLCYMSLLDCTFLSYTLVDFSPIHCRFLSYAGGFLSYAN